MSVILDDIRRLETAYARGEISAMDFSAAKTRLIEAVPEVREVASSGAPDTPEIKSRSGVGAALALCLLIMMVCVGVALLLTGDITLSVTLAITVLAALTVALFRQLDD